MKKIVVSIFAVTLINQISALGGQTQQISCQPIQTITGSKISLTGEIVLQPFSGSRLIAEGVVQIHYQGLPESDKVDVKGFYEVVNGKAHAALLATNPTSEYSIFSFHFTDKKEDFESYFEMSNGGILPLNCSL